MTAEPIAPEPRRGRGRPSRGVRVETKLMPEEVAQVEALIGTLGGDRSEVLATLVRRALAATPVTERSLTSRSVESTGS
jgi:hypothetical protein